MTENRSGKHEDGQDRSSGKRVVGRGMTSPDSTEAVLDASTGEPDPRARGTSGQGDGDDAENRDAGNK